MHSFKRLALIGFISITKHTYTIIKISIIKRIIIIFKQVQPIQSSHFDSYSHQNSMIYFHLTWTNSKSLSWLSYVSLDRLIFFLQDNSLLQLFISRVNDFLLLWHQWFSFSKKATLLESDHFFIQISNYFMLPFFIQEINTHIRVLVTWVFYPTIYILYAIFPD